MSSNQVVPEVLLEYDRAVKLSISLSDEDVEFIDQYDEDHGVGSRSGVVQRAVSLLRAGELGADYEAAWTEWATSDADAWNVTAGDGVD